MSCPRECLLTIPDLFKNTLRRVADRPALGTIQDGKLTWRTWGQIAADAQRVAAALVSRGVAAGDHVAQWAANSYHWILTDLAVLQLGAVHVPLHASLGASQVDGLLEMADVRAVVTDRRELSGPLARWSLIRHEDLLASYSDSQPAKSEIDSEDLASILFTSGTAGEPRGVMLSHANLVSNAIATVEAVGGGADETRLAFLPLSHIYARTCDLYTWIYRGSRLVLVESRDTILRDCQIARPTAISGVPYFYQKVVQGLSLATAAGVRENLLQLLGGNIKRCFCGGAAVPLETERFFARQGLPILSGYGLTEAGPVVTATRLEDYAEGTVGKPIPGVEVHIASDGEVLARGPGTMLGYWRDEFGTQKAISGGWLRTGDLGEFDREGNLRIIGRKKEILILATGKNVAPSAVEARLLGSPMIEHVCVVGEGQKCLGALIVPNPAALKQFIREARLWVWSKRRAVSHPRVLQRYREEIERVLASASQVEQIGPFVILDRAFCLASDELTPKHSLRRDVVQRNFAETIERMYRHRGRRMQPARSRPYPYDRQDR